MDRTRLDRLEELRDGLELTLAGDVGARDYATVSREYRATLAEIAAIEATVAKAGNPVDEITARRAARGAVAAPVQHRPTANQN